jgi:dihydrofolate reductase
MRKIITNTFATLDGIMQAPGGQEEDRAGNFKYGGWSVTYWDDMMSQTMEEASRTPYDLLLGRKTYEIFAAHWPFLENDPMADKFNKALPGKIQFCSMMMLLNKSKKSKSRKGLKFRCMAVVT